jgi:Ni,Fe-hydrogenase III small subunit
MRDSENKPDEELSLLTFGRNTPEFTPILRDRVAEVHKQWVVVILALGACAFSGQTYCNRGQKMILTEFFPRKRICRTNSFIPVKILVAIALFLTNLVFVSGDTSAGDFTSQ